MPPRVLIIEDDPDIAHLVRLHLEDVPATAEIAPDGATGLAMLGAAHYDLVVLDLMLPEVDGLAVCRSIRAGARYLPILMLTARSGELDRVPGLEMGADDYLTKPFSIAELVARIKALLRRAEAMAAPPAEEILERGALRIEVEHRRVWLEHREVSLTAREFELLVHFARHPGRVYSRAQLLDAVWGYSHAGYEHTVNSHINRLRGKIEADPAHPRYIVTVWGVGYKLADEGP